MKKNNVHAVVPAFIFLLVMMISTGCAVNPVTGKKQVSFLSEADEIAMGAEYDPQVVAQFGLYEDQKLQAFIETYGQQMAAISHRPQLKYQFKILDSPVVNAFAVPGGYVYFTRGIMAHFNNEAEFAGVLGHEIGHITARHGAQQYTKTMLAQVAFVGGLAISKELRAFANEADMALQLLFLKFSRQDESQSDQLGVEYSTTIGFDAHEMAGFFQTLQWLSQSEDGEGIPTFLSTHPNPLDRYENVNKLATEWQAKKGLPSYKVNRESYLQMIDGIIYGEDPRQGYVDKAMFYHPELKFQFPVPDSWDLVNTPSEVQMAPADGKALISLSLAEGSSLQDAANKIASTYKLNVTSSRNVTVNGLQALEVLSSLTQEDPSSGATSTLTIKSMYIKYKELIYVIHGFALAADFNTSLVSFDKVMYGFRELRDVAKINVQPERIDIVPASKSGTLGQVLNAHGVPTNRHRELAILNGMDVTENITQGTLIKLITKASGTQP
jgi:predicted Zn-dependent protease